MKVKLKKDQKLSSMNNHSNIPYDKWVSLNQGKEVELDSIPEDIKDRIETSKSTKKESK